MSKNSTIKHSLWETPVWELDITFPTETLLNSVLSSDLNIKKNNLWQIPDEIIKEYKKELIKIIQIELSKNFSNHIVNIDIGDAWINQQLPGESVPIHNHNDSHLTAILYIQTENNSGNLILIDSRGGINWGWERQQNYIGTKSFSIVPKIGKLILLPSYILHCVEENKSQSNRVSFITDVKLILKEK
jgi:uncharacterized protein (TIGR02466 family)